MVYAPYTIPPSPYKGDGWYRGGTSPAPELRINLDASSTRPVSHRPRPSCRMGGCLLGCRTMNPAWASWQRWRPPVPNRGRRPPSSDRAVQHPAARAGAPCAFPKRAGDCRPRYATASRGRRTSPPAQQRWPAGACYCPAPAPANYVISRSI